MGYKFVERTLDQFSMNVDGPYEGTEQRIIREPIAKKHILKITFLMKNHNFNPFVTNVEMEYIGERG